VNSGFVKTVVCGAVVYKPVGMHHVFPSRGFLDMWIVLTNPFFDFDSGCYSPKFSRASFVILRHIDILIPFLFGKRVGLSYAGINQKIVSSFPVRAEFIS
jgi:hypothetical protein